MLLIARRRDPHKISCGSGRTATKSQSTARSLTIRLALLTSFEDNLQGISSRSTVSANTANLFPLSFLISRFRAARPGSIVPDLTSLEGVLGPHAREAFEDP